MRLIRFNHEAVIAAYDLDSVTVYRLIYGLIYKTALLFIASKLRQSYKMPSKRMIVISNESPLVFCLCYDPCWDGLRQCVQNVQQTHMHRVRDFFFLGQQGARGTRLLPESLWKHSSKVSAVEELETLRAASYSLSFSPPRTCRCTVHKCL